MAVVTISRQYGCGGAAIGLAVAEALGAQYVDRALIVEAARRTGVPEDIVSDRDERVKGLTERLLQDIGLAFTGLTNPEQPIKPGQPYLTDAQLLAVTRSIIREVAHTGNAVIVGRGGHMILRNQRDSLHVHIVAPVELRTKEIMRRDRVSQAEAQRLIAREDGERASYIRTNYQADWEDPLLYHLMLNTGLLSQEAAVQTIVLRAAMLDEGRRLPKIGVAGEEDAQHLLASLQAMRDAIRGLVERYRS